MTDSTVVLNQEVVSQIKEACKSSATTYAYLQTAAICAADEMDTSLKITDALYAVTSKYSECFEGNHNLKAIFKDLLTCMYADSKPISFEQGKGDDKVEIHTTGNEACAMSKHKMRAGAKAVREEFGLGRKSGGGRAPQTPTAPTEAVSLASMLDNLLKSEDGVQALRDILKPRGFQLRKVSS